MLVAAFLSFEALRMLLSRKSNASLGMPVRVVMFSSVIQLVKQCLHTRFRHTEVAVRLDTGVSCFKLPHDGHLIPL